MRAESGADRGRPNNLAGGKFEVTGDLIVASRLLVLQSRRTLLASCTRRFMVTENPALRTRMEALQAGTKKAHDDYRSAVLAWANPNTTQFWLVSYEGMIQCVEELVDVLRTKADELPQPDRSDIGQDIVTGDEIIDRWRAAMLSTFGREVA